MRDIKFRAWDKTYKRFIDKHSFAIHFNPIQTDNPNQIELAYCKELYELMQYTGLKDKNGVEIYEGDIVQAIAEAKFAEDSKVSDVIYSDDTAFSIRSGKEFSHGLSMSWGGWESFEVIGNVFENPELLE